MQVIEHVLAHGVTRVADATRLADVYDPATGSIQAQVRLADADEVNAAVAAARAAQPAWAALNPQRRARVLFRFKDLIER